MKHCPCLCGFHETCCMHEVQAFHQVRSFKRKTNKLTLKTITQTRKIRKIRRRKPIFKIVKPVICSFITIKVSTFSKIPESVILETIISYFVIALIRQHQNACFGFFLFFYFFWKNHII